MKRLILAGAGEAHLELLRRLAGVGGRRADLVLVHPGRHVFHTGMVPALIAGERRLEDGRIDLEPLARRAGARRIEAQVVGFDAAARRLTLDDGRTLEGELVSFDMPTASIASGARGESVPGSELALAARPAGRFLQRLLILDAQVRSGSVRDVLVIGAGPTGVETAIALAVRLRQGLPAERAADLRVVLSDRARQPLPAFPDKARARIDMLLRQRGVHLLMGRPVTSIGRDAVVFEGGIPMEAQAVILCAGPAVPDWLARGGLATDARGRIAVDAGLRSVSHPAVFAAGDCAVSEDFAAPAAGFLARQQGPLLAANLRRALAGRPPRAWQPQRRILTLLDVGAGRALALREGWRGGLCVQGRWVRHWKDWLDRRLLRRYSP